MSFDVIEQVFVPNMRHWREFQEFQKSRMNIVPALDKGPRPGPIQIDLDRAQVVIDPAALPTPSHPPLDTFASDTP